MNVRRAGDRGFLLELATNDEALAVSRALRRELAEALQDVVPGHRTVLVTVRDPGTELGDRLSEVAASAALVHEDEPARSASLPVTYDGPDVARVAASTGLSPEEVVRRHVEADYSVAFLGFSPGFAYLLGLDPVLHLPRLETPRTVVPAGSVAIAGPYSGVYPTGSPGGWLLLGRTEAVLFDPRRAQPALLEPGMRVRFEAA